MKELINLLISFKFKELFYTPTNNELIKFFRYAFVGGIAFVLDYATFVLCTLLLDDSNVSVVIATTFGFVVGLIVNYLLSKKLVFTENNKMSGIAEFIVYGIIGVIGYFLNVILMLLFVKWMDKYLAKIIVAIIVLVYNYITRKVILYSKNDVKENAI